MMDNTPNGTPAKTPIWKRALALVGVAAVLGFVVWLVISMLAVGG